MSKIIKELMKTYNETKKSSLLVYFILRFLVIICMIRQIMFGNYESALLCVFIGASVYSILGYLYIKTRNNKNIASKFVITKAE